MKLPAEIIVFLTSMTPLGELRLGIPIGKALGLPIKSNFIWAVMGNITVVLIILALLGPVTRFLRKKSRFFRKLIDRIFDKTRKEHSELFEQLEKLAIILFVAIPLPGSGAWTGSLVSFLFGIPYWRAVGLVSIGVLLSGILVTVGLESLLRFVEYLR
jgi:uncharacterized membrane protein